MIEPLQYRAAVDISRLWIRVSSRGWFATHDAAQASGQRLLDIIHRRYVALRDDVARESFDTHRPTAVIAWERARRMAAERKRQPYKPYTAEVRGISTGPIALCGPGGQWPPS